MIETMNNRDVTRAIEATARQLQKHVVMDGTRREVISLQGGPREILEDHFDQLINEQYSRMGLQSEEDKKVVSRLMRRVKKYQDHYHPKTYQQTVADINTGLAETRRLVDRISGIANGQRDEYYTMLQKGRTAIREMFSKRCSYGGYVDEELTQGYKGMWGG